MKTPSIPKELKDWDVTLIYNLTKLKDVESEGLDFKLKANKLFEDICAMANSNEGIIVLGIDEKKENGKIVEFVPEGFDIGRQDQIANEISNALFNVEPHPKIEIEYAEDESTNKFFPVIKVFGNIFEKPYFVKGTGQCFARLHRSSSPLSRSSVLNLFTFSYERKKNIQRLRSSCNLLDQEIKRTISFMNSIDPSSLSNTAPLDQSFVKDAVISNEEFLIENNFLNNDSYNKTFHFVFHTIEVVNSLIRKFNESTTTPIRTGIKEMLTGINYIYRSELESIMKFLNEVIAKIDEYLSNQK